MSENINPNKFINLSPANPFQACKSPPIVPKAVSSFQTQLEAQMLSLEGNIILQHFVIGRFIGKGGFARVFQLHHISDPNSPLAAVKVIAKSQLVKISTQNKVRSEIRNHRRLRHKHVVDFLGHYEDDDYVYILTELCKAGTLKDLIKQRKRLKQYEVRSLGIQLLDAIEYIHKEGVIHREQIDQDINQFSLKLGNLFLDQNLELKIGDFGLSALVPNEGENLRKTMCGTPNYLAPQILECSGYSKEVDIWAIGIVIYALLTGKPPFYATNAKQVYHKIISNQYSLKVIKIRSFNQFLRLIHSLKMQKTYSNFFSSKTEIIDLKQNKSDLIISLKLDEFLKNHSHMYYNSEDQLNNKSRK